MKMTLIAACVASMFASGCTTYAHMDAERNAAKASRQITAATAQAEQKVQQRAGRVIVDPGVWLGATAKPIQRQARLPSVFSDTVTMIFPERVTIHQVAERITKTTGIPVRIANDVSALKSGAAGAGKDDGLIELKHQGQLYGLLDIVAASAGVNWSYSDGAILFFRNETRSWVLHAIPGISKLSATIGSTASTSGGVTGGAGGGGGTTSSASTGQTASVQGEMDTWKSVEGAVKGMLTPSGKVAMNMATGTITVTDTPDVLARVDKLVKMENAQLGRQVSILVRVFSLSSTAKEEQGIDWNAVLSQLSSGRNIGISSASGTISTAVGSIGVSILGNTASVDTVLKALSTHGEASLVSSSTAVTLNNQSVPINASNQRAYLASVSSSQTVNVGTTQTLTPGNVTTGFSMNLLPHIIENDRILLQYAMDLSDLENMRTITSGTQSIEAPEVSARNFLQRVAIKNGETLVLTGFERVIANGATQELFRGSRLIGGGTDKLDYRKESILIMITPVIIEGAS